MNTDESKIIKPITVIREELITSLACLINESGLPAFVIEPILKDMYLEIKTASRKQYEYDKKNYDNLISKNE